jgi:hypothetical protein
MALDNQLGPAMFQMNLKSPPLYGTPGRETEFDVFISHSYADRERVREAHDRIVACGYSVYVDWINDAQLDRAKVDQGTAALLRGRLKRSGTVFYAVSEKSRSSKWMPWELGFFDAWANRVFIMPLDESTIEYAKGQEYLGLYEVVDCVNLAAFLAQKVPKVRDEMLPPGALAMTADHGRRVADRLPELAFDPTLALRWYGEFWQAWWSMMGLRR